MLSSYRTFGVALGFSGALLVACSCCLCVVARGYVGFAGFMFNFVTSGLSRVVWVFVGCD